MTSKKLIQKLRDAGLQPRAYSGRGMYGRECVAVSGDEWEVASALAGSKVPKPNTDALGKRVIMYWPDLEWPSEVAQ